MSGHRYVQNASSLFEDDDDIDDETFLQNSYRHEYNKLNTTSTNPFLQSDQQQSYEERKNAIENRTLESSYRSLHLLQETEQIGISTAEELAKQREQLENTSKQLDDINSTLRFSQKHINGLKSVFGGLKNYLSRQRDLTPQSMSSAQSSSKLSTNMLSSDGINLQPNYQPQQQQLQQQQQKSLYNNPDELQSKAMASSNTNNSGFNQQLDRNLDEMCNNISRLKGLAIDLNQDIEYQNDLIDTIGNKVDDVDIKIKHQNKDMNHLLGKK